MEITPDMVKELREKTGSGIMDCKRALQECGGDLAQAVDHLRKKGLAAAEKKSQRTTNDGCVTAYIHSNRKLGVLLEINCETDFVARNERFAELAHNVAMQVAAAAPRWVSRDQVPADILDKEREIFAEQMKESGKPAAVIEKIVEGKLDKFFKENCLLEQEYIKDSALTVKDYVATVIAVIGENIQIRRFVRFALGE